MTLHNANGKGKPLYVRLSKEETSDIVVAKYTNKAKEMQVKKCS